MSAAGQQLQREIQNMPDLAVLEQRATPADCCCSQKHLEDIQLRHGMFANGAFGVACPNAVCAGSRRTHRLQQMYEVIGCMNTNTMSESSEMHYLYNLERFISGYIKVVRELGMDPEKTLIQEIRRWATRPRRMQSLIER